MSCAYRSGVFDDDKCVPGNAHAMNIVGYGWGYWKFNVPLFKWEWQYVDYWVNTKIKLMRTSCIIINIFYNELKKLDRQKFLGKWMGRCGIRSHQERSQLVRDRGVSSHHQRHLKDNTDRHWEKFLFVFYIDSKEIYSLMAYRLAEYTFKQFIFTTAKMIAVWCTISNVNIKCARELAWLRFSLLCAIWRLHFLWLLGYGSPAPTLGDFGLFNSRVSHILANILMWDLVILFVHESSPSVN
jgi:hypothetical protein